MTKKETIKTVPSIKNTEATVMSPEALIAQAINKGIDVETMERLLNMRRELKAEKAKEEFNISMAGFQAECPIIEKTISVPTLSGKEAYRYAPIETIIEKVRPIMSKYGFSYSIKTETGKETVKATCIVKHSMGHSEETSFEVERGSKTNVMSNSQYTAAALSFASRYAFKNAFGIVTVGEDREDKLKNGDNGTHEKEENNKDKTIRIIYKQNKVENLDKVWNTIKDSTKYNEDDLNEIYEAIRIRKEEITENK